MTKDELIAILARRIVPKKRDALVWADITAAVAATSAAKKLEIVAAVKEGAAKQLGALLLGVVADKLKADAVSEATAMLADDALTLTELEQVL